MAARRDLLAAVSREFESYAQRGVFRSFSQTSATADKVEFRFRWLRNLPFHASFDRKRRTLSFKKLLPGIPAGSELDVALQTFVQGCCDEARPEHRRFDTKRAGLRYSNRNSAVTLTFIVLEDHPGYAVKGAVHLVNEIFLSFLNLRYPEYMAETFELPEE